MAQTETTLRCISRYVNRKTIYRPGDEITVPATRAAQLLADSPASFEIVEPEAAPSSPPANDGESPDGDDGQAGGEQADDVDDAGDAGDVDDVDAPRARARRRPTADKMIRSADEAKGDE